MIRNLSLYAWAESVLQSASQALETEWKTLAKSRLHTRLPQIFGPILICGLGGTAVAYLGHFPYALGIGLVMLMLVKHLVFPVRLDWAGFVVLSFAGAYAETRIIIASHAWWYSDTQMGVIPLWLAPLWGLVGMCLITTYYALTESE